MKKKAKEKKVIVRFICGYLAVLVIPLLISSSAYALACRAVEESTQKTMMYSLNQSKSILEERLDEIESMVYQLEKNAYVLNFSFETGGMTGQVPSKIYEMQNKLSDYKIYNNFIFDYFIIFPNSEIIVNKNIAYTFRNFYTHYLTYDEMSYDEWQEKISAPGSSEYWSCQQVSMESRVYLEQGLSKKNFSAITYLSGQNDYTAGNLRIMIVIPAEEIEKLASEEGQNGDNYMGIFNADGSLLYSNRDDSAFADYCAEGCSALETSQTRTATIDGQKVFVTFLRSPVTKWSYFSIMPYNVVMDALLSVQRAILAVIVLSVLIGIALTIFLSLRNNSSTMRLINDNKALQKQIDSQKPIMENSFLERLLTFSVDAEELSAISDYLRIEENADYRAFVIQFFDSPLLSIEYFEKIKIVLQEMWTEEGLPELHSHDIGAYKMAFLCAEELWKLEAPETQNQLRRVCQRIQESYPCRIAVSVGKRYSGISQVALSVQDALLLLDKKSWNEGCQILFPCSVPEEEPDLETEFILTSELHRLENSIKGGLKNETVLCFDKIRSHLLHERDRGERLQCYIFLFTAIDFLKRVSAESLNHELDQALSAFVSAKELVKSSFVDSFHQLKKLCVKASELFDSYHNRKKEDFLRFVTEYIERNYTDPLPSVPMIAEQLHISESSLSKQFKTSSGENISLYIENVRLKKATELLEDRKRGVQEIALEVGYNSANTFNKAFRKKYGVSPSVYRKITFGS